jgi:hypothetical protein
VLRIVNLCYWNILSFERMGGLFVLKILFPSNRIFANFTKTLSLNLLTVSMPDYGSRKSNPIRATRSRDNVR